MKKQIVVLIITFLLGNYNFFAQTCDDVNILTLSDAPVFIGDAVNYNLVPYSVVSTPIKWFINGNQISEFNNQYAISIIWTEIGIHTLSVNYKCDAQAQTRSMQIPVYDPADKPQTPNEPLLQSPDCIQFLLVFDGTPPADTQWYWQTLPNGTGTGNNSSPYTITETGIYYLRAVKNGLWSDDSASYSVDITDTDSITPTWYNDQDNDGLGDPTQSIKQCEQPTGYVSNSDDQCPEDYGLPELYGCSFSASMSGNYILTLNAQKPVDRSDFGLLTKNDLIQNITYYDGLGRPNQSIAIRQGGQNQDIITNITYDNLGRQAKEYLPIPVANNNGVYKKNIRATHLGRN